MTAAANLDPEMLDLWMSKLQEYIHGSKVTPLASAVQCFASKE